MRIFSYILMVIGILLLANAGYDEFRGNTRISHGRYTGHYTITREASPEKFHDAIVYHTSFALLLLIAGFIACLVDKGQEKADPLSTDTDRSEVSDDLGGNIKKEEEHRDRPKL